MSFQKKALVTFILLMSSPQAFASYQCFAGPSASPDLSNAPAIELIDYLADAFEGAEIRRRRVSLMAGFIFEEDPSLYSQNKVKSESYAQKIEVIEDGDSTYFFYSVVFKDLDQRVVIKDTRYDCKKDFSNNNETQFICSNMFTEEAAFLMKKTTDPEKGVSVVLKPIPDKDGPSYLTLYRLSDLLSEEFELERILGSSSLNNLSALSLPDVVFSEVGCKFSIGSDDNFFPLQRS